jgi:hypothetical protein
MSICIAPAIQSKTEYLAPANVLTFLDRTRSSASSFANLSSSNLSRPFSARTIALAREPGVDELKYRKLIDLAVRYGARLLALKRRDITARYEKWCQISESQPGSINRGLETESYWRNKNLYVRRISRKSETTAAFMPVLTEIACLFSGGSSLLITIDETEHTARFDVIESCGKTGYCLDGLGYDLALSQVFSLLKEIEGV